MTRTYYAGNTTPWVQVLVPAFIVVGNDVRSVNSVIEKLADDV
jgi:hypothetical protein